MMEPATSTDDLRKLWQEQPVAALALSAAEIRAEANKLRSVVAARNRREWGAAAVVIICFAASAVLTSGLVRVGSLIIVAAAVFIAWVLHARGGTLPDDGLPAMVFYRRELERQRDLLRGIWWWYLGPLTIGMIVLAIGVVAKDPGVISVTATTLTLAAIFALNIQLGRSNLRAAAELQRQIDAIPATGKLSSSRIL